MSANFKTWQERLDEYQGKGHSHISTPAIRLRDDEIADLRAAREEDRKVIDHLIFQNGVMEKSLAAATAPHAATGDERADAREYLRTSKPTMVGWTLSEAYQEGWQAHAALVRQHAGKLLVVGRFEDGLTRADIPEGAELYLGSGPAPADWQWVPKEPTEAMLYASDAGERTTRKAWAGMLAAAAAALTGPTAPPGAEFLLPDDMAHLQRFAECCDDSDAGDHDVSKEKMARLGEIGLVASMGFGRCQVTAFGNFVLGRWSGAGLPLRTAEEHNEASRRRAEHSDRTSTGQGKNVPALDQFCNQPSTRRKP